MYGRITDLVPDRGFGFITDSDGHTYFFHRGALMGVDFEDLVLRQLTNSHGTMTSATRPTRRPAALARGKARSTAVAVAIRTPTLDHETLTMPKEHTFRPGEQHPERWRDDLNPNRMVGQNIGLANPHPEQTARTAYDVKEAHRMLEGITDDGLKQIPVLSPETRLETSMTMSHRHSRRHKSST
jgi:hypothetical protein